MVVNRKLDEDARINYWWLAIITLFSIAGILIIFTPGTYMNDYANRAGGVWKFLGVVSIIAGWIFGWQAKNWASNWKYYLLALGLIFMGPIVAAGFNLDTFGIKDRP